jgi:hypothetical protein
MAVNKPVGDNARKGGAKGGRKSGSNGTPANDARCLLKHLGRLAMLGQPSPIRANEAEPGLTPGSLRWVFAGDPCRPR